MKKFVLLFLSTIIAVLVSSEKPVRHPETSSPSEETFRRPLSASGRSVKIFRTLPPEDRPIIIRYNIPNHRDRGHSETRGFRTSEPHLREPLPERKPKKFKERDPSQITSSSKLKTPSPKNNDKDEEKTLLTDDLSNQESTETKQPDLKDEFNTGSEGKHQKDSNTNKKSKKNEQLKDVQEKAEETTQPTDGKETTTTNSEPLIRVFPYLLIGKTHAGVKFPFLAMMREKSNSDSDKDKEPFVPAFIALAPDSQSSKEAEKPELIAAPIFNLPLPHIHDFEPEPEPVIGPPTKFFHHPEEMSAPPPPPPPPPPSHLIRQEEFREEFHHPPPQEPFF